MLNRGVRLQLLVGSSAPLRPAPYELVCALQEVEVQNNDEAHDGFRITFSLGREKTAQDFILLKNGLLKPNKRLTIMVIIQGRQQVLINGMITRHQVLPSYEPGGSRLQVMGDDTGSLLSLEKRTETHPNESDAGIVRKIIGNYTDLEADVPENGQAPSETERVPSQHDKDLDYVMGLAQCHGYVFFTEPTARPGISKAYWGPRDRPNVPKQRPALSYNMGAATNVEEISFDFNGLGPVQPTLSILDPITKSPISIPLPDLPLAQLSSQPAEPLRKEPLTGAAKLNPFQAELRLVQTAADSADAVVGRGSLDVLSYGRALQSRRRVDVRGVGQSHDGTYYVKRVTHQIRRGDYKQSFVLVRRGRGAMDDRVTV